MRGSQHRRCLSMLADRFTPSPNIFAAATKLAMESNSLNLGQGFPSFAAPEFLKNCIKASVDNNENQYTQPAGHPKLMDVLCKVYSPLLDRSLSPSNVTVCNGAQSGIFNIMAALVNPVDDEVVVIEPFFDAYKKAANLFGVDVKGVPLRSSPNATTASDFHLDLAEFESALSEKTKLLILNTPHNPTGKVFSLHEMEAIAKIVKKFPNIVVLSDEVYEFMTFDNKKHVRFAGLDDMFDRTISLFSAGKIFSATGIRIGHCIGPEELIGPLAQIQSVINFCAPTALQAGVADAFLEALENNYFEELATKLQTKRDRLCGALEKAGMNPIVPEGGYFVLASTESVPVQGSATVSRDVAVNEYLTKANGVTGIPISHFYSDENKHLSDNVIRYAYCKQDHEIDDAVRKFENTSF